MTASCAVQQHSSLYLDYVSLWMVLNVSMLRLGFVERRVERELELNCHFVARSKSSAVARSFDMEHLRS